MRVLQGGHDVPTERLKTRYPRILVNLRSALRELPQVWTFHNDDLRHPFRLVTVYANGQPTRSQKQTLRWLASVLD